MTDFKKGESCEEWQDGTAQQTCDFYIPCSEHPDCGVCGNDIDGECMRSADAKPNPKEDEE